MSDVEVTQEGQATVFTINRPEKLNAINKAVAEDLQAAFAEFDASDQRVAIITGAGGHFSSGADVTDMPELWRCVPTVGMRTDKPVIAAVDGWCVGGGMLLADELSRMAPMVLSTLKSHVNDEMLTRAPMEKAAIANMQINRVRASEDLQEGLAAFREKRAPVFRNR